MCASGRLRKIAGVHRGQGAVDGLGASEGSRIVPDKTVGYLSVPVLCGREAMEVSVVAIARRPCCADHTGWGLESQGRHGLEKSRSATSTVKMSARQENTLGSIRETGSIAPTMGERRIDDADQ